MLSGCRHLLELLLLKDVIRVGCRLLLGGLLHVFVHVRYVIVHVNYFIILLSSTASTIVVNVINHLHLVVHVGHLAGLARIGRPCLKPAIFKLDLLDGACR